MSVYFSPETMGFYPLGIPDNMDESTLVELTDDVYSSLKGQALMLGKDGKTPELYKAPPPTEDELKQQALYLRDQKLRSAAVRIAPLQDAVDIGDATDAELAQLNLWKTYRVALNRIQDQPGYPTDIKWPETPDATE